MAQLGELVARRPRTVIAIAVALWAVSLLPATRLELRFDLESLLPDGSSAAQGYAEFMDRFDGVKRVFVILERSQHTTDAEPLLLAEAASRLAEILEESGEVVEAKAGLTDDDVSVFLAGVVRRAPLLIPGDDWLDQVAAHLDPEAIHDHVWEIRTALLSPVPVPMKKLAVYDPLGFSQDLLHLDSPGFGRLVDPMTLSFLSPDNRAALVFVEPAGAELDATAGRRLRDTIEKSAATLQEEFGVEFRIQAVGGPLYAAHDEAVIRSDLVRTLTVTSVVCGVLVAAVFSGVGIPAAGLAALAAGLTWLAAVMTFTSGGVSAVAIGFSAVLVGLGIDSAIHGGVALRRHLLAGDGKHEALVGTFRDTGRPILAAASTTAAAFAVLLASNLPLLRELGSMVAVGMGLIVLSTATLGAALALLAAGKSRNPGWIWRLLERGVNTVVGFSSSHPRSVLASAALLTAITIPAAMGIEMQPDLNGLRPSNHPVLEAELLLAETFGITENTTTVLIRGQTLDEALTQTRSLQRTLGDFEPRLAFTSPAERIAGPAMTENRLRALMALNIAESIAALRTELRLAGLNAVAFAPGIEALEALAAGRDPGEETPHGDNQLKFDSNGDVWAALTVHHPEHGWSDEALQRLQRAVADSIPNAMIASVPLVGLDLRRIATHDLRRLSMLSLFLVFGIVLVSFRGRVGPSTLALVPVALGTTWALGFWSILGRHLDLVSLAVLPVMFGLGIDDGLYAVHGAVGSAKRGIRKSLERSGRAMVLTTITTCIGFGSLTLSHLPALRAAAVLVPIGVGACLVATLAVLPAIVACHRRKE